MDRLKMNKFSESDVDWQSRKNVIDSNKYMLANEIACDITFLVGDKKTRVAAHKYMLISRSCVFHSMFCGPLAETGGEITLPDIEPEVFRTLLRYIYYEDIDIRPEMVLPLLYTAKKYSVQLLAQKCIKFLEVDQSSESICTIFEQAQLYDEKDLEKKCMDYICSHAKEVMNSEDFLDLTPRTLTCILASDEVQVDEKTVFTCMLKWAERECERKSLEPSMSNQRQVLGDLLYQIRFPLLGETFYTEVVADMEILNDAEKVELFKFFFKSGTKTKTSFITRNRFESISASCGDGSGPEVYTRPIKTCTRYRTVYEDGSWYCGGEPDAISFTVNKTIQLHGVLVYGSYIGEGVYEVTCSVYDHTDKELVTRRTQLKTSESQHTYPVLLESPIDIPRTKKHTMVVKMLSSEGLDTYQGKNGSTCVTVGHIQFSFSRSKHSRNGTDVKIGQIPGILFTNDDTPYDSDDDIVEF